MSTTVTLKHEGVCAGYVGPFSPGKRDIDGTIDKRTSNCQTNMACFALWDPVCGSDGMTYGRCTV